MKIFKRLLLGIIVILFIYGLSYAWRALPIISGYGAKMLCSCVMVAGRNTDEVIQNELGRFPLSQGTFSVNFEDSSATGSVLGMARKKAIYRKGLGCTLINEIEESALRNQPYTLALLPALDPDTIAWPMGNVLPDSLPFSIDTTKLETILNEAFSEPGPEKLRKTRSILIVYDGHIIAERYAPGFDEKSKQIGWSMSKSVTNALVGILVKKGKLNIFKPAPISFWKDEERNQITLNNLLHASSGLEWEENYASPSSATNMLFKKKDMGLYAASHKLKVKPETVWKYSSGTSNIISWIVRQTVGDKDYYRFPAEELFHKIGSYSMILEPDAGGTFVGSSYSFATARDWARFGLLFLNNGNWMGEQILPEDWVAYSTTPALAAPRGEYGAQWWLNAGEKDNPANRYYPNAPEDLYWADGYEGQNVFIIPSEKLVVVKLSLSQGDYLDDDKFLVDVINCLPK